MSLEKFYETLKQLGIDPTMVVPPNPITEQVSGKQLNESIIKAVGGNDARTQKVLEEFEKAEQVCSLTKSIRKEKLIPVKVWVKDPTKEGGGYEATRYVSPEEAQRLISKKPAVAEGWIDTGLSASDVETWKNAFKEYGVNLSERERIKMFGTKPGEKTVILSDSKMAQMVKDWRDMFGVTTPDKTTMTLIRYGYAPHEIRNFVETETSKEAIELAKDTSKTLWGRKLSEEEKEAIIDYWYRYKYYRLQREKAQKVPEESEKAEGAVMGLQKAGNLKY